VTERKVDHHFLPRSYLRAWSADGRKVWTYRTLVSHSDVPLWKLQSIRSIAYHQNLYTRRIEGVDSHEFEEWLDREIETPAAGPLQKAIRGSDLSSGEWAAIGRFIAAQDLRTPTSYLETKDRWTRTLPGLMNNVLTNAVRDLKQGSLPPRPKGQDGFENPRGIFNVNIEKPGTPADGTAVIRAEVTIGRALWLEGMRRSLTRTAEVLGRHTWSLAEAADDTQWFTTDHPVMKLNFYSADRYDFRGGWGSPGTEIMMPISPRLLLYTQVGAQRPHRFQFSRGQTFAIQKMLAERAFRFVFASRKIRRVAWHRRRVTDREKFLEEK